MSPGPDPGQPRPEAPGGPLRPPPDVLAGLGGITTLDSYGPGQVLGLIPEAHYEFLEGCLDLHEIQTHIFVHANYFPDIPMAEQDGSTLRWESLRETTPGPHESGKTVIMGHTSQKGGEVLDLGHLKCIDTYCHGGGWLTALEVGTEGVWQADREGGVAALMVRPPMRRRNQGCRRRAAFDQPGRG
jgi:hypothetical protein